MKKRWHLMLWGYINKSKGKKKSEILSSEAINSHFLSVPNHRLRENGVGRDVIRSRSKAGSVISQLLLIDVLSENLQG